MPPAVLADGGATPGKGDIVGVLEGLTEAARVLVER